MLRFSDSKLGGISTAYAAQNEDGTIDVKHLEPDTLKILQVGIKNFHFRFYAQDQKMWS